MGKGIQINTGGIGHMKSNGIPDSKISEAIILDNATTDITGNATLQISDEYIRDLFNNPYKLKKFKAAQFSQGTPVDIVSGNELVGQNEAKRLYGDKWQEYAAETDHSTPLKDIYDRNKSRKFISDQDLRSAANVEDNYSLKSKTTNSSKQDSTNVEMIDRLQKEGIELDRDAQRRLRREQRRSSAAVQSELRNTQARNITSETITGATEALEASAIPIAMDILFNIIQVCDNKKDIKTAVTDVAKVVGAVAVTGSATRLLNTALQNVDNPILQFALEHNLPAQIIAMALLIKDDIKGIKDKTLTKAEATSNILSKFAGVVGGKIGTAIGTRAITLMQQNTATKAIGGLLGAYGGSAIFAIPVAIYASAVAKNLFDEVVGKGSWEAIKNSNANCQDLAVAMKEAVNGIKTNVAIFNYAMSSTEAIQSDVDRNLEVFEQRKK